MKKNAYADTTIRATGKKLSNHFILEGEYQYLSPEEEIVLAEFTLSYLILQLFRFSILADMNPEKRFDYDLGLLLISRQFDMYRYRLVEGCRKDKDFGKQILKLIEARIESYEKKIPENFGDVSSDAEQ